MCDEVFRFTSFSMNLDPGMNAAGFTLTKAPKNVPGQHKCRASAYPTLCFTGTMDENIYSAARMAMRSTVIGCKKELAPC
jgi:hypothetical protein